MKAYILRRRKLGKTSCKAISKLTGIDIIRNDRNIPNDPNVLCIRWGCTSTVPQSNVLNSSKAIHLVSDKTAFRRILQDHHLCPRTWFKPEVIPLEHGDKPIILRPRYHHQGRHLYLPKSWVEYMTAWTKCPGGYASELIDKIDEYRVFVGSGRVLCVASKTPQDGVAWNVAQGGEFKNVRWDDWPLKAIRASLEAFKLSGLDFGGVDVITAGDGSVYILEVNSAPSLTSPYRQSAYSRYFDYVLEHGKAFIPLIQQKGGYRKFIHPAVCNTAL